MKIIIQPATMKNLSELQKLNLELFKQEKKEYDKSLDLNWTLGKNGTDYFKKRIAGKDGCVLIALADNKIVGYLCGCVCKGEAYRNLKKMAELENMFVAKEWRLKGIGGKLTKEFMGWCKRQGAQRIKVEAFARNKQAIGFYKKNGFKDYISVLEAVFTTDKRI